MPTIDFRTSTIPADRRVWRLFPGESYRFLSDFKQQGAVFLDLPSLSLPDGPLNQADQTDLLRRVLASLATKDAVSAKGPDAPAVTDLKQFEHSRRTQQRARLLNALTNLISNAQLHDLVVVPSSIRVGSILVGRFTRSGDRYKKSYHRKGYGEHPMAGRYVRWLTEVPENKISTELSQSLRHQHAFSVLESGLFPEVFSLVYDSYIYNGLNSAKIANRESDYIDQDSALLGILAKAAAVVVESIESGKPLAKLDFGDVFLFEAPIEYACSQTADIHSIGFQTFNSSKITPFVFAAIFAGLVGLAGCSGPDTVKYDASEINYVNTGLHSDPDCSARVSEASKRFFDALPIDDLWQSCILAKRSAERAGLDPSARFSPERKLGR